MKSCIVLVTPSPESACSQYLPRVQSTPHQFSCSFPSIIRALNFQTLAVLELCSFFTFVKIRCVETCAVSHFKIKLRSRTATGLNPDPALSSCSWDIRCLACPIRLLEIDWTRRATKNVLESGLQLRATNSSWKGSNVWSPR